MARGFLLMCSMILAASYAADPCYMNQTRCQSDLRQLLLDKNTFWFGTSYEKTCPGGPSSSTACANPDLSRKSVLSRLLSLDDTGNATVLNQTAEGISLVNITFNAPAGNYTGCGQVHQVPGFSDYLVDPLNITLVSSWSLSYTPKVTWNPRTQNTQQVLVIWDPGNSYLHGLYVNCVNGSLDSGEVVRPYLGPLNGFLRPNTIVFAVYEQKARIDRTEAYNNLVGKAFVQPAQFVANYTTSLIGIYPVHAGLLTVVSDAYSVEKIATRFFMANNCPYLISQLEAFHTLVAVSNLTVSWSDNQTAPSVMRGTPYLTSLTVNINVRFQTDDYSIESCCSNYSLTSGSTIVNPFTETTVRPGNVRNKPYVQLTAMDMMKLDSIAGGVYTLFLLDVAAALVPDAKDPMYVTHWMVTNIRNADVNTGDQVAQFFGPNPMTPGDHRPYMFLLFRQPEDKLNNSKFAEFCPNGTMRCRIHLKAVLDALMLKEIVGLTWFLAEQDGFSRYRRYAVLNVDSKDNTCRGLPGYANPCPAACPNNNGVSPTVNLLTLALLFGITVHLFLRRFS